MTTAADTPHADALEIFVSPNGKWFVFDFKVGEKHAFVSMDVPNFPAAFQSLLAALNVPSLAKVTADDLPAGYHRAEAVKPLQYGSSITPLGDNVILAFELPGGAQFRAVFDLSDATKLRLALDEAINKCSAPQTRQ